MRRSVRAMEMRGTGTRGRGDTETRRGDGADSPRPRVPASPRLLPILLLVLSALLVPLPAHADELDDRTRQIAKQLQCPVCESVSVADSPSELAGQMRTVIRQKLEAGESEAQVVQYFVARYGDQVLVEPPKRGFALAVWWAPVAIAVGGLAALAVLLRAWLTSAHRRGRHAPAGQSPSKNGHAAPATVSRSAPPPSAPESSYEDLAREELERFRREVGA